MTADKRIRNAKLPPIYEHAGRKCYLDPIRQRLIFITPEETVRQRVLSYLTHSLHVPDRMIQVEIPLAEYGIKTRDRADIIVEEYDSDSGKRFCLGTLRNDHLCNLDQPDVIKLVENLISYALIRDEYRKFVKGNR